MDREHRKAQRIKRQVFVYPLERDALQRLREETTLVEKEKTEVFEDSVSKRESWLEEKRQDVGQRYELIKRQLDERGRRCWMGAEALALGHGGLALVSEVCGASPVTVKDGMSEVQCLA